MAPSPTEGRVARPERRWGCRRGTPTLEWKSTIFVTVQYNKAIKHGNGLPRKPTAHRMTNL